MEKLRRAIIEAIHGLPYEEALEIEQINQPHPWYTHHSFTLSRVLQSLHNEWTGRHDMHISRCDGGSLTMFIDELDTEFTWKLTKENSQECTLEDQTDETIESLIKLLTQEQCK